MTARHAPFRRTLLLLAAVAALAAALLLAVGARPAQAAATITVNTTSGWADDGRCSLVEAIKAANTDKAVDACPAGSGADTIYITRYGTITAPAGGFEIASNMTIQGNSRTRISGGGGVEIVLTEVGAAGAPDTVGATRVKLADLTITGATGADFPDALAGGAAGASLDGPVLLVTETTIPKATATELGRLKPRRIIVLGVPAVVAKTMQDSLDAYLP